MSRPFDEKEERQISLYLIAQRGKRSKERRKYGESMPNYKISRANECQMPKSK